ncbi:MAG: hypothetical protein M1816_002956 [Peltula sp. TS41687]|nr:MAG: hypothetical protein M1816_002956 [Peltula sp. TS41687]
MDLGSDANQMADHRYLLDLTYGHLGQAIYDTENKTWCFSREPGRNQVLKPLGPYEIPISAPHVGPDSSHEIGYSLRKLARTHPEIVPAISSLPSLAQFSEVITDATSTHDPTISARIAIGEARDVENQRSGLRTIPLLAVVSGLAGESLRLLRIEKVKLGWENQASLNTAALNAPDFTGGEEGWWAGAGGPIKQVCSSQKQGRGGSWLALRQLNSTTILRPLYHRIPVFPSRLSQDANPLPPSRMNANALVTLPMSRTGGSPHSDVTFNPWYNRQFGIVDHEGHWSVWNVEGERVKRDTYRAKLEQGGPINEYEVERNERAPTDGWGGICWVGNVYTFAVFGRRDFAMFDLSHNPALRLPVPDIGLSDASRWILDVKASPTNENHLFVVTTSQIFWLEVVCAAENKGEQSKCTILLSWRHSRYEEDTSLQLSVVAADGDSSDTTLLLYSRYTSHVTVFQFAMHAQRPTLPVSLSDPYNLEGLEGGPFSGNRKLSNLVMLPVQYITGSTVEPKGLGRLYMDHDVRFYALLVLGNDLSLGCRLYTSGVTRQGWNEQGQHKDELVKAPNVSSRRNKRAAKSTTRVIEEVFVVEDEAVEESDVEEVMPSVNPRNSKAPAGQEDPWTLNWEWLYKLAFLKPQEEDSGSSVDAEPVNSVVKTNRTDDVTALRERLMAKRTAEFRPIETMLELHGSSFQPLDLVQLNSHFNNLMESCNMQTDQNGNQSTASSAFAFTFKSLIWPLFPGVSTEPAASTSTSSILLNAIHNHISLHWLTPIRAKVPAELYASNEQIATQVAISIYLASIGVQLHPRTTATPAADQQPANSHTTTTTTARLPLRFKDSKETPSSQRPRQEAAFSSSAPSYAAARTRQPSNHLQLSASQQPTPSAHPSPSPPTTKPTEDPSCTRLRAYTPVKPQPPLPGRLSTILAEWSVGDDPASYSWEASQRALNPVMADDNDDDKKQLKDKAQRRRRDRRQQQQQQRWEAGKGQSGIPSFSSSQPDPNRERERVRNNTSTGAHMMPRMAFSNRVAPPEVTMEEHMDSLPMTQVERGAFGGRHTTHQEDGRMKTKKRKREAGF